MKLLMNLSIIGLSLIVFSWVIEFFLMTKKKKINVAFVAVYLAGVAILVYDSFMSGSNEIAIANLVSLVVSGAVLIKILAIK